jgi:tetratricopeptide (TPR) repeat protein
MINKPAAAFAILGLFVCTSVFAETKLNWQALLDAGNMTEARKSCSEAIRATAPSRKAEGYKCLANIALREGDRLTIAGNELGGAAVRGGYTDKAVNEAIKNLDAGIEVAPQDLSIHQGRLWVLMNARRYDAMIAALRQSISIYKDSDPAGIWISYSADLFNEGQMSAAIRVLKVLEENYPRDFRVHGNLSGAYAMLKNDPVALKHARLAVELAPTDPINTWNLGRILDYMGQYVEAEKHYSNSLRLEAQTSGRASEERQCVYAELLADRLNDKKKLCSPAGRGCKKFDEWCDVKKSNDASK